jgi:hypothetical protein
VLQEAAKTDPEAAWKAMDLEAQQKNAVEALTRDLQKAQKEATKAQQRTSGDFRTRLERAVKDEMVDREGGADAETWKLQDLEGPHQMAN